MSDSAIKSISQFIIGRILPIDRGGVFWFGSSSSTRSAKKKRKSRNKRNGASRTHRKKGRRYTPRTAGKRKDTSRRRIRYTKNGQPYVIMASGKARFISMKSAKSAHKRRGGKY
jgi:hypothetical protein